MEQMKKTIEEIKQSAKERIEQATDKGLEVSAIAMELAEAIAEERGNAFIEQAQQMITEGLTPKQCGLRQLSKAENEYYQLFGNSITDFKQALTAGKENIMPTTVITKVFEDLQGKHELLKHVKIAPAGLKKWIVSSFDDVAAWGKIDDAIVKEIAASIDNIDLEDKKLSAFFAIPKGVVDLGYEWLDKYIREILAEALYKGLKQGIVAGDGKDAPIGMMKDLENSSNGIYADKVAVPLTAFDPKTYGETLVSLTNGGKRELNNLIMVVNPTDYLTKVMPAMSFRTPTGEYMNSLPIPTKIIQDVSVPQNKAVIGLANKYLIGASKVDVKAYKEVRAIDDQDVHIGKVYANGRPEDNISFIVADITNLEPTPILVQGVTPTGARSRSVEVPDETVALFQEKILALETELETLKSSPQVAELEKKITKLEKQVKATETPPSDKA